MNESGDGPSCYALIVCEYQSIPATKKTEAFFNQNAIVSTCEELHHTLLILRGNSDPSPELATIIRTAKSCSSLRLASTWQIQKARTCGVCVHSTCSPADPRFPFYPIPFVKFAIRKIHSQSSGKNTYDDRCFLEVLTLLLTSAWATR